MLTGVALSSAAALGVAIWLHRRGASEPVASNAAERLAAGELAASVVGEGPRSSRALPRQRVAGQVATAVTSGDGSPGNELELALIEADYVERLARGEGADPGLDQALTRGLQDEDPVVVARALAVASLPFVAGVADPSLVTAIAELAVPTQPVARRQAALVALSSLRPSQRSREVLERFGGALQAPEPPVITTALRALLDSPRAWERERDLRASWAPIVIELTEHPDPGVRGRALALSSLLDETGEQSQARARRALRDAHPYVRAVGCDILGRRGQQAHVHDLIPLVADLAEARYELTGWRGLDGEPAALSHTLPGRDLVADAALHAVATLAAGDLELSLGGRGSTAVSLQSSIARAQAWYAVARPRLPSPLP